jgi:hypothetical protein
MQQRLTEITTGAIMPALRLLPSRMSSDSAVCLLLAIGLQESRFTHRRQIGGPARGFWQFESGGGVRGVMTHPATREHAKTLCAARGVPFERTTIYSELERDDVLAAGFARLLLFSDPRPLPDVSQQNEAWDLYLRTWRPGKPHPHTWPELHKQAASWTIKNWSE